MKPIAGCVILLLHWLCFFEYSFKCLWKFSTFLFWKL